MPGGNNASEQHRKHARKGEGKPLVLFLFGLCYYTRVQDGFFLAHTPCISRLRKARGVGGPPRISHSSRFHRVAAHLLGTHGSLVGEPAAPLPCDRPSGTCAQIFLQKFFHKSPCCPAAGRPGPGRPTTGRPGYIPVNFENENIFV